MGRRRAWAARMLFVWRYRLGYWDWDAFKSAWRTDFVVPRRNRSTDQ